MIFGGVMSLVFLASLRAQDVRISEFLASNVTGIKDEDGTFQGWIEIWNSSPTVNYSLSGWKLKSGTSTWVFPSVELPPDERMIVWASGKNRTVAAAPLHTSFTLPKSATYLGLLNASNVPVSEFNPTYPAQSDDISYGRDFSNPTLTGFYTNPTPGNPNNFSGSGVAKKVLFSVPSKAFTSAFQVTLSQATPEAGAEIRYTTNQTIPTATSSLYSAPITIAATTLVRARVFKSGVLPGETESSGYLWLSNNANAFSSALPIVALTNFGLGAPPDTGEHSAYMWVFEPGIDGRSRFTNLPTLVTRVAIDRRGSSTSGNPKFNLNVEARRAKDDVDSDITLLGMPEGSDWVFHAPYDYDRSLIHNPLMQALSNSIERYASRCKMAEVFIDTNASTLSYTGTTSGDYFGVYNVMEKIRRSKDRVDIKKLNTLDNDTVGKTGGYIIKVDRKDSGDVGFTTPHEYPGGPMTEGLAYYYPKEIEILSPQRDPQEQYIKTLLNGFDNACYNVPFNDQVNGYRAYLDTDAAIDHHLLNVWAFNLDALRLSAYITKERGGKLAYGPIWDFDRSLSSTDGRDANPVTWRSTVGDFGTDFFNHAWWNRLFSDLEFYQAYIDRWQNLRRSGFSAASVNAQIDALNAQISSEAISRDLVRWGQSKRSWTSPFTSTVYPAGQAAEIQRIKDYMQQRANFFDTQWVGAVNVSPAAGNVAAGTQVTLSSPAGSTIYYTTDGSDPRPVGGGVPSGANVFAYTGTPITINATKRIRARAYKASHTALTGANNPPLVSKWSGRTDARYSTDTVAGIGNLTITEINYHPTDPTSAELAVNPVFSDGDFEYIELKNIGVTAIDLAGAQFTTGVLFTFTGEQAITVAPGAFVIVAANPSAFAARYGSSATVVGPFKGDLSDGGEQIVLKSASGATILDFTYDDAWYQPTDGSGYTLALYDPLAGNGAFSTSSNWRQSSVMGGSPAANEPNAAPTANAGADVSGNVTGIALAGSATDDRQPAPPNALTYAWSLQSGPGTATFTPSGTATTNASFSVPGIYFVRLTVSDSILSHSDTAMVYAKDTPDAWLARHPGIGTLNDDFDGDGYLNFGEFALGLNPSLPDASAALVSLMEGGHLTLSYTRIKPPAAVVYSVEVADALGSFRAPNVGEVSEQILSDSGLVQAVKVTDSVVAAGQAGRYLRLKITPAP